MRIATRCGMRLYEADCQIAYVRLYLTEGDHYRARASLAAARDMIQAIGYHRRDAEVASLENEFG